MRSTISSDRKCSALLAAGAGAAVCLTAGGQAAGVTGHVSTLNVGGQKTVTVVAASRHIHLLPTTIGGTARFYDETGKGFMQILGRSFATAGPGTISTPRPARLARAGALTNYVGAFSAGVTVGNAMPNFTTTWGYIPHSLPAGKYFAIACPVSLAGYDYGWVSVASTSASGLKIVFDKWGYNPTGATIKTLSESVTTRKLGLSDGRAKLHWANTNEDGVARYEVQAKDPSGQWQPVESSVPGENRYSATLANNASCRLAVQMVDGATHIIDF